MQSTKTTPGEDAGLRNVDKRNATPRRSRATPARKLQRGVDKRNAAAADDE